MRNCVCGVCMCKHMRYTFTVQDMLHTFNQDTHVLYVLYILYKNIIHVGEYIGLQHQKLWKYLSHYKCHIV